jgi:hypothetical protein
MAKGTSVGKFVKHQHVKHKGIQAKTKQSHNKGADNYFKKYKGQGK